MPGFRAHLVGGVAAFGLLSWVISLNAPLDLFTALHLLLMSLLGSLFPDVDVKSKGQGLFYKALIFFLFILLLRGALYEFVIISFIGLTPLLVRHRGLFHQPWFLITMPFCVAFCTIAFLPAYKFAIVYATLFFIAGALSHILLDRIF